MQLLWLWDIVVEEIFEKLFLRTIYNIQGSLCCCVAFVFFAKSFRFSSVTFVVSQGIQVSWSSPVSLIVLELSWRFWTPCRTIVKMDCWLCPVIRFGNLEITKGKKSYCKTNFVCATFTFIRVAASWSRSHLTSRRWELFPKISLLCLLVS